MDLLAKRVLYIDLSHATYAIKLDADLHRFIGGFGAGLKLLATHQEEDPVVFSIGPLNGLFPFCSKTSIVCSDNGVIEDLYLGGSLSSRIRFAGVDSIVVHGRSKNPVILDIQDDTVLFSNAENTNPQSLGLPGKRSMFVYDTEKDKYVLDKYFNAPEKILEKKLLEKNVYGVVVTGSTSIDISDYEKYEELYKKILKLTDRLTVEKNNYPSCIGCPMGCQWSKVGEIGGNVLPHSLVACNYAEKVFSDVSITFSCLNFLGYDYTHEDIENFPEMIKKLIEELKQ